MRVSTVDREECMYNFKSKMENIIFRGFNYLKYNPGAIFVILFMIAIATAAGFLMDKKEEIAIHIANLAYLFLVIGTVIYMVQIYREKRIGDEEKGSSN